MGNSSESREKSSTRAALLAAAEALFTKRGYAAVGTREIAEAAGANLGAIQYHFGSKPQLFVEVVRSLMRRRDEGDAATLLMHEPASQEEAVQLLCSFINALMEDIFSPVGYEICRLLFREILADTSFDPEMREAIISSAAEDFMRPIGESLRKVLLKIESRLSEEDLRYTVHSIFGQCVFYFTNQQFIERLCGHNCQSAETRQAAARHVARFTLAALGCSREVIDAGCANVFGSSQNSDGFDCV